MLQIAVDTVYEMTSESTIKISLLNHSEIMFIGDLEWSVEAMINVIKNCMEHTQDGAQNLPDGGAGFSIRFYSRSANTFLATDTAFKTLGNPV